MPDDAIGRHPGRRTPAPPPRVAAPQAPRTPPPPRPAAAPSYSSSPQPYQPYQPPRYRPPESSWSQLRAQRRRELEAAKAQEKARKAREKRQKARERSTPPPAPAPVPVVEVAPPRPVRAPVPAPMPKRETPADRARAAGVVADGQVVLPAMTSWEDFLARATAADTTGRGHSRLPDDGDWAGASFGEAVRLATDGWAVQVPEVDLAVLDLRTRMSDAARVATLVQVADVAGSEVDVAAFLDGVPECMVETEVHRLSTQGRVVTFMVPAGYSSGADHASIVNRGKALCALCVAIVAAGHSVEVWTGFASRHPELDARCSAVARVISAGEPFDPSRLMFAMAHPAMLRRLWCGVWDAADPSIADAMQAARYGNGPFTCSASDLPEEIGDAYVFPYLSDRDTWWAEWDSALAWSVETFAGLGLLAGAEGDGLT